jgi:hypothetical protein
MMKVLVNILELLAHFKLKRNDHAHVLFAPLRVALDGAASVHFDLHRFLLPVVALSRHGGALLSGPRDRLQAIAAAYLV